jgi:tetrahydromethanopterin S-methyltransferase subunit G
VDYTPLIETVNRRIDDVHNRLDSVDSKLDRVDTKMDEILSFKYQIIGGSIVMSSFISLIIAIFIK